MLSTRKLIRENISFKLFQYLETAISVCYFRKTTAYIWKHNQYLTALIWKKETGGKTLLYWNTVGDKVLI